MNYFMSYVLTLLTVYNEESQQRLIQPIINFVENLKLPETYNLVL
jgi:hypothetical protein